METTVAANSNADAKISPQIASLIVFLLEFIKQELVTKLEPVYVQNSISETIEKLKLSAVILSDDEPDREQLRLIWSTFTTAIGPQVQIGIEEAADLIRDRYISELVKQLAVPVTGTVVSVTDGVKPDNEQIKQVWVNFIKSDNFEDYITQNLPEILALKIKNPRVVSFLVQLIKTYLNASNN